MPTRKSHIGTRFGRWKVIADAPSVNGVGCSVCLCDCGTIRTVKSASLTSGKSKSCGCLQKESTAKLPHRFLPRHGQTNSGTYRSWTRMINRCTNPRSDRFEFWGARGITVCERWRKFENFFEDMGERPPGMTIERVGNSGNYEPGNCVWATRKQQARNRRSNRIATVNGITGCIAELCEHFGVSYSVIRKRIHSGWAIENAIQTSLLTAGAKIGAQHAATVVGQIPLFPSANDEGGQRG